MHLVHRLLQFWAARAGPGANAQQFFAYIVLFFALMTTVLVALSTEHPYLKQANTLAALLWMALLAALHHGVSITKICHWGTAIALMQIVLRSWFSGGVYASALAWLPVLVVGTYFLLGRSVALVWAFINLLVWSAMAFLPSLWDVAPMVQGLAPDQGVITLVDQSLAFISVTLVMVFYYQFDEKALADLLDRQNQLQTKSEQLTQREATRTHLIDYAHTELQNAIQSIAELNGIIAAKLQGKPGALLVLEHTQQSTQAMLQSLQTLPKPSPNLEAPKR